jgi:hypothetical protein
MSNNPHAGTSRSRGAIAIPRAQESKTGRAGAGLLKRGPRRGTLGVGIAVPVLEQVKMARLGGHLGERGMNV